MICFPLQEGELHPPDPIPSPGCVSFGQIQSCFILGTGMGLLYQLLNNNTPVRKLGLGGAEDPSRGAHYAGGMTSWFTLAG